MKGVTVGSLWVFVVVVVLLDWLVLVCRGGWFCLLVCLLFFVCLFVFVNLTQLSFLGRGFSIEKMLSSGHEVYGTFS